MQEKLRSWASAPSEAPLDMEAPDADRKIEIGDGVGEVAGVAGGGEVGCFWDRLG